MAGIQNTIYYSMYGRPRNEAGVPVREGAEGPGGHVVLPAPSNRGYQAQLFRNKSFSVSDPHNFDRDQDPRIRLFQLQFSLFYK